MEYEINWFGESVSSLTLTSLFGCHKPVKSKAGPIHGFNKTITLKFGQWHSDWGFRVLDFFGFNLLGLIQVSFTLDQIGIIPGILSYMAF